ncbi:hypothetical protein SUGI_1196150 [Cryptomeria japonica]|nr:hypothetical protein SUGI_1196150 [Cryptomeria japonica]
MRNSFLSGGGWQVYAECPRSVSIFSPPCKQRDNSTPGVAPSNMNNRLNSRWEAVFSNADNAKDTRSHPEALKNEAQAELTKASSKPRVWSKSPSPHFKEEAIRVKSKEDEQENLTPNMMTAMRVIENKTDENLTSTKVEERSFLIQELLNTMDEEDIEGIEKENLELANLNQSFPATLAYPVVSAANPIPYPQTSLGVKTIYLGKDSPDCAKESKNRGRKSLYELRSQDGKAKDQVYACYTLQPLPLCNSQDVMGDILNKNSRCRHVAQRGSNSSMQGNRTTKDDAGELKPDSSFRS